MATTPDTTTDAPPLVPSDGHAALHFNAAEYLAFLAEADATEEQKIAFLEAVWHIVVNFVDMGFRIHPLQQAIAEKDVLESDSISMLKSDNSENADETDGERT